MRRAFRPRRKARAASRGGADGVHAGRLHPAARRRAAAAARRKQPPNRRRPRPSPRNRRRPRPNLNPSRKRRPSLRPSGSGARARAACARARGGGRAAARARACATRAGAGATAPGTSAAGIAPRGDAVGDQGRRRAQPHLPVKRFLARGGMGEVFDGCNVNIDERVAIKVMLPALAGDEKVVAMFRKEARTLTKLQHRGAGLVSRARAGAAARRPLHRHRLHRGHQSRRRARHGRSRRRTIWPGCCAGSPRASPRRTSSARSIATCRRTMSSSSMTTSTRRRSSISASPRISTPARRRSSATASPAS